MSTLHLVSHTHWDREWYQTFQQFRLRLVRLVDNLLDILSTDPQYLHFMLDGQAIVLEDYLQVRPEREGELRGHIQAGRILVGPWYILPDEFLVSPEATIRNLLEGDKVTRGFGPKMRVGYLPDTFGHIGQMAQILCGFGIDTACVWRGLDDQPCEFWWQAPDGSRVLTAYIRDSYGNAAGLVNKQLEVSLGMAHGLADALRPFAAAPHLLLMNGSDHQEPSPLTSQVIAAAQGNLNGDVLLHSTLPAYLAGVKETLGAGLAGLPVVSGELRSSKRSPLLPGVLSARLWIKQRNRACETLLERWAEPFSTLAEQAAKDDRALLRNPAAVLRQAWRLLLQCHPHDSICGCSIDAVHEEMRGRFDQVETIGEEITRQALEVLAGAVSTIPVEKDALAALVVLNPSTAARAEVVSAAVEGIPAGATFEIVDEEGTALPFEVLDRHSETMADMILSVKEFQDALGYIVGGDVQGMNIQSTHIAREGNIIHLRLVASKQLMPDLAVWEEGLRQMQALAFDPEIEAYHVTLDTTVTTTLRLAAPEVPGMGYRTLWVRLKEGGDAAVSGENEPGLPNAIENEYFRVEACADGTFDLFDKTSNLWYRGQNRLVDGGDRGDEYNFSAPGNDELVQAVPGEVRVERGAVQQALLLQLKLEIPDSLSADRQGRSARKVLLPVTARVTLTNGLRRVDIRTEVENLARDHRLRAHFTVPFAVSAADFDGHYEVVRRPIDLPAADPSWVEQPYPQKPQRTFTAISDGSKGLLVANRGLPEAEVLRTEDAGTAIAVTLLRCVGWLSRADLPERKDHAGPGVETPGAQMAGKWSFDLALLPFREEERLQAYQRAYAFESPLRAVCVGLHEGTLPAAASLVQVEPEAFTVSALKAAEDGRGWLVRGVNLSDQAVRVRIKPLLRYASAEVANLAEDALESLVPEADGSVSCEVGPHALLTVVFKN